MCYSADILASRAFHFIFLNVIEILRLTANTQICKTQTSPVGIESMAGSLRAIYNFQILSLDLRWVIQAY